MQTNFSAGQLADPEIRESDRIFRSCVHCGLCTATCPTYVLLGDELDSPRGRIYLIKDMLENDKPANARIAKHIDRCLSCLSCMTTCPADVHYMHLVDYARVRIEETYRRPWRERLLRSMLATVLPRPGLFRLALIAARASRPIQGLLPGRLERMLGLAPRDLPGSASAVDRVQVIPAKGVRRMRVALLNGCVQRVLAPEINEATVRLLSRLGCEVVVAKGAGCCGALTHHLGRKGPALVSVKRNIAAWHREIEGDGLDAIVSNASGCGTMLKDYGFILRNEPAWAERAERISNLASDVSETLSTLGLESARSAPPLKVAHHSACSLQHGQRIREQPVALLSAAGYSVHEVPEGHLCCGSAGSYNLLEHEIADRLLARKVANIESVAPDVVVAGNIGCIVQIAAGTRIPVVHTVELLDWASGGPVPKALARSQARRGEGLAAA